MKYVEIFVNGMPVDLPRDDDSYTFVIDYLLSVMKELGRARGYGTKTVTVPRTKKSDQAFGLAFNSTVRTSINKSQRMPCVVKENGEVIIFGWAKLLECSRDSIEFIIGGNNATLKTYMGEKKLTDLNLSDLDHEYTGEVAFGTWDGIYPAGVPADFFYPVVDYGHLYLREADIPGSPMVVTDLFPAMYVKRIFRQIFIDAGIKLETSFFDRPEISKTMMPFAVTKLVQAPAFLTSALYKAQTSGTQTVSGGPTLLPLNNDSTGGNFDNGGNYDTANSEYQVPSNAVMSFAFSFTVSSMSGTPNPPQTYVGLYVNGALVSGSERFIGGIGNFAQTVANITVQAGDLVSLQASDTRAGGSIDISVAQISNTVSADAIEGSVISMAAQLPAMRQQDFMNAMILQFNMMIDTDPDARTCEMEAFTDFVKGDAQDWTDKLSMNEPPTIRYATEDVRKRYVFSYQPSDDQPIIAFDASYKSEAGYGNGIFVTGNDYLQDDGNVESKFFATLSGPSYNVNGKFLNVPQAFKEVPATLLPPVPDGKMRLLINAGPMFINLMSGNTYSGIYVNDGSVTLRSTMPLCYFVKEVTGIDAIDAFKTNLAWSFPAGPFNWNGLSLIQEFYEPELEDYIDLRMVEAGFRLKGSDVSNLDFRRPVLISHEGITNRYRLLKVINYTPMREQITDVLLIRIE